MPTNVAFPGLPVTTESLIAVLFGGNPDSVTRHIDGSDGFVEGGEELLGDLIETDARNDVEVSGLGVVEALAPYLPVVTGALTNSTTPFDDEQV